MKISIIVAFDENKLIGKDNRLPWHLPADLKHFKTLTMGHHMIMGRKTYDSIGKPLPGRVSIVVTRQQQLQIDDCVIVNTLEDAIKKCEGQDEVFIIGGAEIFKSVLPITTNLYITQIHYAFDGDTYFPDISETEWQETSREKHFADEKNNWDYSFINYSRKN